MSGFTLERLMLSPDGFDLARIATPCQRAMWRMFDGLPVDDLVEANPELAETLATACGPNDAFHKLPTIAPREIYMLSGVRTAKSLSAGGKLLLCALTCDCSELQPWEEPVASILSIKKAKAKTVLRHILGPLKRSRTLRKLIVGKPTSEMVRLRRPTDGRTVRIEVVAGAVAGGSLVSDWSAGVVFDEFARMSGEEDGSAINFDEQRKAVLGRLLPGAQIIGVTSPYAPSGPAWEVVQDHWGGPSEEIVVVRPPARAMNPVYWTEARIARLLRSPKGAWVYRTDYLGEFADPISAFFALSELEAVTRKPKEGEPFDVGKQSGVTYFAAMDPAKRRNAWTLVVGGRAYLPDVTDGSFLVVLALARQWVPTPKSPLDPKVVLMEIATLCRRYGVLQVYTDQWKHEELAFLGKQAGLTVTDYELASGDAGQLFDALRMRVLSRGIELHPEPYLRNDLLAVQKIVRRSTVTMDLPVTSDGRHCDYAPAVALLNEVASRGSSWVQAMKRLKERDDGK